MITISDMTGDKRSVRQLLVDHILANHSPEEINWTAIDNRLKRYGY